MNFPISLIDRSDSLSGEINIRTILDKSSGHLLKTSITFKDSSFYRKPDQLEQAETRLLKDRVDYSLPDTIHTCLIDVINCADITSSDPYELDAFYLMISSKKWKEPKIIWKINAVKNHDV